MSTEGDDSGKAAAADPVTGEDAGFADKNW